MASSCLRSKAEQTLRRLGSVLKTAPPLRSLFRPGARGTKAPSRSRQAVRGAWLLIFWRGQAGFTRHRSEATPSTSSRTSFAVQTGHRHAPSCGVLASALAGRRRLGVKEIQEHEIAIYWQPFNAGNTSGNSASPSPRALHLCRALAHAGTAGGIHPRGPGAADGHRHRHRDERIRGGHHGDGRRHGLL